MFGTAVAAPGVAFATNRSTFGGAPSTTTASFSFSSSSSSVSEQTAGDIANAQSRTLPIVPSAQATEKQKELWEREDKVRALFVSDRQNAALNDPHLLLIDVYANASQFVYQPEEPDEYRVPKVLAKYRNHAVSGAAICNEQQFRSNFESFTGGMFKNFNW